MFFLSSIQSLHNSLPHFLHLTIYLNFAFTFNFTSYIEISDSSAPSLLLFLLFVLTASLIASIHIFHLVLSSFYSQLHIQSLILRYHLSQPRFIYTYTSFPIIQFSIMQLLPILTLLQM